MSASKNADSVTPAQGEIHSRVAPSKPLTHKGHAPGIHVGNDAAPEFHAETFPPGTAPKEQTFLPHPEGEVPGQANNPIMSDASKTSALDSLPGATSGSVYNAAEHGKPIQGQTSQERHSGKVVSERQGYESLSGGTSGDGSVFEKARKEGLDLEGKAADMKGTKGSLGRTTERARKEGAESRIPVSAEEVASERR